jgi:hypothetical protein
MAKKSTAAETPPQEARASDPPPSTDGRAHDEPVQVKPHPRLEERNNYIEQLAERAEAGILAASPPEEPADEGPAQSEQAGEPPPPAAKTRKIKVDGEEQEVPEDKILDAGVRALQKESAADRRLQEATEKLTRAEQLLAAAERQSAPSAESESPPSGSPDADVTALAKAIQFGTEDEVKAAVKTMLDRQGPGRSNATPPPEDVVAVVEQRLEFKSALNKFQSEFKDVWDDPYLRKLAFDEDDRLQKEIIAGNREPMNYLERFVEAGKAVREWRDRIAGSTGTPKVDISADKRDRKAAAGSLPTAGGRAAPVPAPAAPSNPADIVREMRQARGQL